MRKSSSYKDKLYVHDSGLCVSGRRIKLSKIPKPQKCYSNKNITIDAGQSQQVPDNRQRKLEDNRRTFKLNVTDCQNVQVYNKQLKQIYETVEVSQFEKILNDIRASDVSRKQGKRRHDILDAIKADEIYEELFGQYYSYLKNAIKS